MHPNAHKSEAGDAKPPSSTSGEMYELEPQKVYPRPRFADASLREGSEGERSAEECTSLRKRTVPKSVSAMWPVS